MAIRLVILLVLLFSLAAAGQTGCLAGQVLDDSDSPLAQMHVIAYLANRPFSRFTNTDENGRFLLTDLPLGSYLIVTVNQDLGYTFSNSGDFSEEGVHVVVSDSAECTATTMRRKPRAAKLRLNLTDSSTGKEIQKPIASFRRTDGFHGWDAVTQYQNDLLVPPAKPLDIQVGAVGYGEVDVIPIAPLQPGEVRVLSVQLQPIGVGCLTGMVLAEDGTPVGEVRVGLLLENGYSVTKESLSVPTNQQGKFTTRDLHPGTYLVSVDGRDQGYSIFSLRKYGQYPQVSVLASPTCAELTLRLAPPGARLHLEVVDAITQQPIKYFRFTVDSAVPKMWWPGSSGDTDELLVPPDEACSLKVRADGYKSSSAESLGTFQPGEVRHMKVLLQPDAARAPNTK